MKPKVSMNKTCCLHFLQCLLLGAAQECAFHRFSTDVAYPFPTKICCNGTFHERKGQQCCNGELYNPNQKICCNNSIHDRQNRICCGSELHTRPQIPYVCCEGEIHYDSQKLCCGGKELYDPTTQICCDYKGSFSVAYNHNRSRDCCYDKNYDINTEHCVGNKVLGWDEDFCGSQIFKTNTNKCCNGKLHEIRSDSYLECCGENLFNPTKDQCCNAYKIPVSLARECCGKGSINKSTEICCNGVALQKEANMRCCGTELVDGVTKGCCAARPYNISTDRCCRNENLIQPNQSCCGSVGYDNRTQKCNYRNHMYHVVKKPDLIKNVKLHGICLACVRSITAVAKQIRMGNLSVCKRNKFKIQTTGVALRLGRFWIMHVNLMKSETSIRKVRLIVPCKCGQLNNTREFVLLTDIDVHRRTVRLGDSDLLLTYNQRLEKVINRKRNRCRNAGTSWFVEQMKGRALKEVEKFIDRILPKERF